MHLAVTEELDTQYLVHVRPDRRVVDIKEGVYDFGNIPWPLQSFRV